MNCKEFQRLINESFAKAQSGLSDEMKSHVASCGDCAAYLGDLSLMQAALNEPRLAVRPGELDDITFEKIASLASAQEKKHRTIRLTWPVKWVAAPAILAAAAILIIMLARPQQNSDNSYADTPTYSSQEMENTLLSSDTLGMEFLTTLAGDDSELEQASDELMQETDVDDLISGMSPAEIKALYDKIDNWKG